MIEGDIRIETTVDTYQNYQEKVEAAANMLGKMEQRDKFNKGHDEMAIPYVEEFFVCIATFCYNLWVFIMVFLMGSQK